MQAMAATLSDADMQALGAYFSQQKPKGLSARDPSLVKSAQQLWRGGNADARRSHARRAIRQPARAFQRIIRGSQVSTPTTRMRS